MTLRLLQRLLLLSAAAQVLPMTGLVSTVQAGSPPLSWKQLPELPTAKGFGGPLVGVHGPVLIVAGGANFPQDPPWSVEGRAPGTKVWYDDIYVLTEAEHSGSGPAEFQWRAAGKLPFPLAYAATVSLEEGMYVLGGETFGSPAGAAAGEAAAVNHPTDAVLLLKWNAQTKQIDIQEASLPRLPRPSQYHAAEAIGRTLYVVASHAASPASRQLDESSLWALDLDAPPEQRRWRSLPAWPGAPREKMAFVAQKTGAGTNETALFLVGGSTWARHADGTPDDAHATHFADGARFDPVTERWTSIADLPSLPELREIDTRGYTWNDAAQSWMHQEAEQSLSSAALRRLFDAGPRPLGAAPAIADDQGRVLIFSGATGRYVTMDVRDRPPFPNDVLAYDPAADRWARIGDMPLGVVTTTAVRWRDRVVIPSGEVRPGVRTRAVQMLPLASLKAAAD